MGYVEQLPSGRYRGVLWNALAGKRGGSRTFDSWVDADTYWRHAEEETDCSDEMVEEVMRLAKRLPHEARIRVLRELMTMHTEDEKMEVIRSSVESTWGE